MQVNLNQSRERFFYGLASSWLEKFAADASGGRLEHPQNVIFLGFTEISVDDLSAQKLQYGWQCFFPQIKARNHRLSGLLSNELLLLWKCKDMGKFVCNLI